MASTVPFSSFVKMSSGLVNLLGSRSTLLSGRTPPLYCKAVLRGNIMQKLVARFNGVSASGGDLVLKQLEKKLFKRDAFFYGSLETSAPLESNFLFKDFQKSLNYKTSTCESTWLYFTKTQCSSDVIDFWQLCIFDALKCS